MIYAILIATLAWAAPQDQTLRHGTAEAIVTSSGALIPTGGPEQPVSDQTLQTSVHDPEEPEEPWVVTTHRRSGESMSAFLKRHRETVDAVRAALRR